MTPMSILPMILRIGTDLGAGYLATEIVKNLAPNPSNMHIVKKILLGLGGFGVAESIRFSATDAIDRDIKEIKEAISSLNKTLKKDPALQFPFGKKKKKPKVKQEPYDINLPESLENWMNEMDDDEMNEVVKPFCKSVPMDFWRETFIKNAKEEGDEEFAEELKSMSDEEFEQLVTMGIDMIPTDKENFAKGMAKSLDLHVVK